MDGDQQAQASLDRFIDRLGNYFGEFGLPRIAGRILGLLLIADRPLSLDEVASALHVSRGSVSSDARLVIGAGLIERVGVPGDRRTYYIFSERAWDALIDTDLKGVDTLRTLAVDALHGLGAGETPARARLESTLDFLEFYHAELAQTLARWRALSRGEAARAEQPRRA